MQSALSLVSVAVLISSLFACTKPKQDIIHYTDSSTFDGAIETSTSPWVKKMNMVVRETEQTLYLPVKDGAPLTSLDPQLVVASGISLTPSGALDFTHGSVKITLTKGDESKTFTVMAAVNNNPVIEGYYADPEIIYSKQFGKYFLYPTSDGFDGWSGSHFETFSSTDLVHWTNEGTILDLKTDVSWSDRNAWAPTAIEKNMGGVYKYFYYFTASQRIGVAVADNPAGPFTDSGQPLIDFKPEGIDWGQEIDPDVFHDPQSGKDYLYWGNGYMAVVELNDDMVSVNKDTMTVLTPDNTFREGAEVFYRNGIYYFLWSDNDTRDPDYRVRYAMSSSPTGPLTIPENNMVIAKNVAKEIFATGHNAIINKPGTDEWFIVYHRFNRPEGLEMGGAGGFHREVCIDRLTFDAQGHIIQVTPTLTGISSRHSPRGRP